MFVSPHLIAQDGVALARNSSSRVFCNCNCGQLGCIKRVFVLTKRSPVLIYLSFRGFSADGRSYRCYCEGFGDLERGVPFCFLRRRVNDKLALARNYHKHVPKYKDRLDTILIY